MIEHIATDGNLTLNHDCVIKYKHTFAFLAIVVPCQIATRTRQTNTQTAVHRDNPDRCTTCHYVTTA